MPRYNFIWAQLKKERKITCLCGLPRQKFTLGSCDCNRMRSWLLSNPSHIKCLLLFNLNYGRYSGASVCIIGNELPSFQIHTKQQRVRVSSRTDGCFFPFLISFLPTLFYYLNSKVKPHTIKVSWSQLLVFAIKLSDWLMDWLL